jgi:hypothetical protein
MIYIRGCAKITTDVACKDRVSATEPIFLGVELIMNYPLSPSMCLGVHYICVLNVQIRCAANGLLHALIDVFDVKQNTRPICSKRYRHIALHRGLHAALHAFFI